MGQLLNAASIVMCPHGGMVSPVPSSGSVSIGGSAIVLQTDTFMVAGCAFATAAGPHPCMLVDWQAPAVHSTSGSVHTLTTESVGMCKAADGAVQGTALIQSTQPQVSGL